MELHLPLYDQNQGGRYLNGVLRNIRSGRKDATVVMMFRPFSLSNRPKGESPLGFWRKAERRHHCPLHNKK